jgi:hypothetical protein
MQRDKNFEFLEAQIDNWVTMFNSHREVELGEWLYTFSIQMALALRACGYEEEDLPKVLKKFNYSVSQMFAASEEAIDRTPIQ